MAPRKPKPSRKTKGPPAPKRIRGFREVQDQRRLASADILAELYEAYGFACAFTGRPLKQEAAIDPRGYLLNLADDPATLDPTRLIPATLEAIFAFERGHVAIGPNYNILTDLEHIDPEFAERLNPIGRLRLPAEPAFCPSQAALTPHLIAFASGRKSKL